MQRRLLETEISSHHFSESVQESESGFKVPVVIIKQGLGNLRDKNYYSKEAIESGVKIYEGAKAYLDHPTPSQEREQPNRSVKELCGHYENCKVDTLKNGLVALKANFVPLQSDEKLKSLIKHAVEHAKKYPDRPLMGISINGDGEGETLPYDEFLKRAAPSKEELAKIEEVKGQAINYITKLTNCVSADLVTEAGAGGGFKENNKVQKTKGEKMLSFIKKFAAALSPEDRKLVEQEMEKEFKKEGEVEKKEADEAAALEAEAKGLAGHLMAVKKEMKKGEQESEEAYEEKCMGEALKKMKQAKQEAEKKEADKAAAPAADAKKDEPAEEKKEAADPAKDAQDPAKHDDVAQDKELIKQMMKRHEELEGKVDALLAAKDDKKEAKKKEEKAALVDKVLGDSGLPRKITSAWKSLLESKETEAEMVKEVKRLQNTVREVASSYFAVEASRGITEISSGEHKNNNHFFKK